MCTLKLTTEEAQFRKVWDQHVGEDTSMYHYSAAMAKTRLEAWL